MDAISPCGSFVYTNLFIKRRDEIEIIIAIAEEKLCVLFKAIFLYFSDAESGEGGKEK